MGMAKLCKCLDINDVLQIAKTQLFSSLITTFIGWWLCLNMKWVLTLVNQVQSAVSFLMIYHW